MVGLVGLSGRCAFLSACVCMYVGVPICFAMALMQVLAWEDVLLTVSVLHTDICTHARKLR